MAELELERSPAVVPHTELTAGRDVTHLLSHINQNFRQSKADQIFRLLRDQDKIQKKVENVDDEQLLKEYDLIVEETVVNDSDTLTESSSISEIDCDIVADTGGGGVGDGMNGHSEETARVASSRGYRGSRSRTSMGFHADGRPTVNENAFTSQIDTRDITVRPKSSYVRRSAVRRHIEAEASGQTPGPEEDSAPPQRPSKSARPKSRLGRASLQRERKIVMIEADSVVDAPPAPVQEAAVNVNTYDRFASVRQPKRESKRGAKTFCDSGFQREPTVDNMSVDSSNNSVEMKEEVTEVQPLVQPPFSNDVNVVSSPLAREPTVQRISSFNTGAMPRGSPAPAVRNTPVQQTPTHPHKRAHVSSRVDPHYHHMQPHVDQSYVRSETMVSSHGMRGYERYERQERTERGERHERNERIDKTSLPQKQSNSNSVYHSRPKMSEPPSARVLDRDMRPSTRSRRLQRRYMPQTQHHPPNVRPTSESVILARQKTEKSLLKQKTENRPHSEKIVVNSNKMLSVSENPTQGPQTYLTSKSGVTQASHVQTGGFRGYDPSRNPKPNVQSRDIPSDLTLPRQRAMNPNKGPLALMKLPPLEASLAAKKKERGLTLAQRETCV